MGIFLKFKRTYINRYKQINFTNPKNVSKSHGANKNKSKKNNNYNLYKKKKSSILKSKKDYSKTVDRKVTNNNKINTHSYSLNKKAFHI